MESVERHNLPRHGRWRRGRHRQPDHQQRRRAHLVGGRTIFLGLVTGAGPYTGTGTVEYDGVVNPATSPALVTYAGDVALRPSTTLDVLLGGTTAGSQYDQFAVTGAATLDGTLSVSV